MRAAVVSIIARGRAFAYRENPLTGILFDYSDMGGVESFVRLWVRLYLAAYGSARGFRKSFQQRVGVSQKQASIAQINMYFWLEAIEAGQASADFQALVAPLDERPPATILFDSIGLDFAAGLESRAIPASSASNAERRDYINSVRAVLEEYQQAKAKVNRVVNNQD